MELSPTPELFQCFTVIMPLVMAATVLVQQVLMFSFIIIIYLLFLGADFTIKSLSNSFGIKKTKLRKREPRI